MFCKNCGKELNDDARFCANCGAETVIEFKKGNNEKPADLKIVNPVVTKLKGFEKSQQATCLECGYTGPMGVVGYAFKPLIRYGVPLLFSMIAFFLEYVIGLFLKGLIGGYYGVIGYAITICSIVYVFRLFSKPKILFCPNCEKNVVLKNIK